MKMFIILRLMRVQRTIHARTTGQLLCHRFSPTYLWIHWVPSTTAIKALKLYHNCVSRVVVLKLQGASESSGKFVKVVGALLLEFLIHRVKHGAQEYEFITCFQVMLTLLVCGTTLWEPLLWVIVPSGWGNKIALRKYSGKCWMNA